MRQTPTHTLAELRLGEPLDEWVHTRRVAGAGWRTIAAELAERTGQSVSHETLRGWFRTAAA